MADASFDIVIMGEILEHCLHDAAVLYEAKRVLRPNGALIVTAPFWSHNDPTHIRTHSPQSIQRLLNCCGFEIEEYVERPGIPFLWILNYTIFPFALVYYYLCNKSLYVHIIKIVGKVNFVLGRSRLPRRLIGIFGLINWGCTIKAKVGKVYKYKEANIATFIR
jgi:SAM-dependent methyltransferase